MSRQSDLADAPWHAHHAEHQIRTRVFDRPPDAMLATRLPEQPADGPDPGIIAQVERPPEPRRGGLAVVDGTRASRAAAACRTSLDRRS